jgi:hypothetical protein
MTHRSKHLPNGSRITDELAMGILARAYPTQRVKEILQKQGKASQRERELPAHLMVYYVMGLGMWMGASCREVLRCLLTGVHWLLGSEQRYKVTGKSGITQARQRLGWEVMKTIHDEVVCPIAQPHTPGAWYRKWRIVSLDGSTLDVADSKENVRVFGFPPASRGHSAYPQLRFVSLLENGTHVLFASRFGSYRHGELKLAEQVIEHLQPGMLCLADRLFTGGPLWKQATQTGADLLWRCRRDMQFRCVQRFADGSYLSYIYPKRDDKRKHPDDATRRLAIRVIEYRLRGSNSREPWYRLITTLIDPEQAPARELAALYQQRWEMETTLDEFKVHLRGPQVVLRSQTPDLVRQEFYGLLMLHFAVRSFMHEAALSVSRDPDELSFLHAVQVLKRHAPMFVISPSGGTPSLLSGDPQRDTGRTGETQMWSAHSSRRQTQDGSLSTSKAWYSVPARNRCRYSVGDS